MSEADDWASVKTPDQPSDVSHETDDWESAGPSTTQMLHAGGLGMGEPVPEAFLDRLRAGQALDRVFKAATAGAKEGMGQGTPTGFEDETLNHLIDLGIFHDPAKGRGGPLHMLNESVMMPAAQAWQAITRATAGGIHGAGGAVEQLVNEFGGSQGEADRAKNEIINLGNWAMIEGGMGRFERPSVGPEGVTSQTVGGLPTETDFAAAGKALGSTEAPANLRRMWQEDGIHPAEAVHDAQSDAFLKHEITAKQEEIKPVTIATAAIKYGDKTYTGAIHPDAVVKLADDLGVDVSTPEKFSDFYTKVYENIREGFLTSEGEYVGRLKAAQIAEVADQYKEARHGKSPLDALEITMPDAEALAERHKHLLEWDVKPEEMEQAFGNNASLSAAVTPPEDIPPSVQPTKPPGSLIASAQAAAEKLFDVGRDVQMKLTPMARGSTESMATVKDYMNAMRRNAWDWSRTDTDLEKRFTPEQRARMWSAMDEESTSLRLGEPASAREHQGLATLTPEERAAVVELDTRQQLAWLRARDLGMVEGEGIAMHAPRMVINIDKGVMDREGAMPLDAMGYDLRTRTPGMRQRKYVEVEETEKAAKAKYGEQAVIARDIRTVALSTAQLEDAIAGRTLIDNIKDVGKRTGEETVAEGWKPGDGWFTIDHPAFKTWRPKFKEAEDGKVEAVKDAAGNPVFEQVPIYVRGDFEGPLRSAMWGKTGAAYSGMMALKGKTMGLIMNSPMIHNLVEFGRAFPAMPTRIVKAYFDGNRAKNDPGVMHEAINAGLVPIGKRFFNQDINAIMESPSLTPGRSWTSQILAAVPGLFDEAAGTAVKRAIDKAGDFWHNTLLWDRIADLQMGLYVNFRGDLVGKGMDPQTASRVAAHFANRYAGALPKEAMSEAATKVSNFLFFSRSFTFGNMGVMKDMLTGLPKDVLAQIERDAGFRAGSIEGAGEEGAAAVKQAVTDAKSIARRKAMMIVGLDVALMYAGNSVLQNAFNVMLGDSSLTQEGHEYLRRAREFMNEASVHPLSLLNPFQIAGRLSATNENEPSRKDRTRIGYAKDGTAIYARNPVGKIGEEFANWFSSPLDMLRKKEGTIARPLMQVLTNDAGFGRKIYDPQADSPARYVSSVWNVIKHITTSQLPVGQITAFSDLVKGEGDKHVNMLQAFGPFAGVTFSKGAPGGPAVGELYDARQQHDYQVNQAMPDIKRQILRGDVAGAQKAMTDLAISPGLQRWYIKSTLNPATRLSPRAMKDFQLYSTDEQKARMNRARQAQPAP